MTVEVMTSEGLRTGSAVREVRFSKRANGGDYGQAVGEAVALDLPNGGTLFALLSGADGSSDHGGQHVWHIMRQIDDDLIELWPTAPKTSDPRIAYPAPMLVTFDDLSDPTSVKRVDPDDLAASFGEGVSLSRVTIEATDQPVTDRLADRLAKLGIKPDHSLDNDFKSTTNPTLAQRLAYRHFKREIAK
ncbi:hypothetical protein [Erythrobacter longus]|nr:hypothetical protein [Erythrobacter longus]